MSPPCRASALVLLVLVSLARQQPAWAGESSSGLEYLAVYGKFGDTPLLILARPRGAPLTIRLGFGLRQADLDSAAASRLLSGFTPAPIAGLDDVTVYTVPGMSAYELSYPQGGRPVLSISDPSESPGTGGHDGGCGCS